MTDLTPAATARRVANRARLEAAALARDATLLEIARTHTSVETLNSDGLDLHDISATSLKAALEAAYEAGFQAAAAHDSRG